MGKVKAFLYLFFLDVLKSWTADLLCFNHTLFRVSICGYSHYSELSEVRLSALFLTSLTLHSVAETLSHGVKKASLKISGLITMSFSMRQAYSLNEYETLLAFMQEATRKQMKTNCQTIVHAHVKPNICWTDNIFSNWSHIRSVIKCTFWGQTENLVCLKRN